MLCAALIKWTEYMDNSPHGGVLCIVTVTALTFAASALFVVAIEH